MQDPEEVYNESLEKEDEEFLKGLEEGKSLDELEKNYVKKTKKLRKKFQSSYGKYLKKHPPESEKTPEEKKEEEETLKGRFKVKPLNLERSWKDEASFKLSSKKFKVKRKANDFFEKITPDFILKIYYKFRKKKRVFFFEFNLFFEKLTLKIKSTMKDISSFFKRISDSIVGFLKKISEFVNKKIGRKKKSEDKKEDKKGGENGENKKS